MNDFFRRKVEQPRNPELRERRTVSFKALRELGMRIDSLVSGQRKEEDILSALLEGSSELGVDPEDLQVDVVELDQIGQQAQIELTAGDKTPSSRRVQSKKHGRLGLVAAAVMLASGCGTDKQDASKGKGDLEPIVLAGGGTEPLKPSVSASGGKDLPDYPVSSSNNRPGELKESAPPDCGAKPEHAPSDCGVHQWQGYSETNPVAVSWLAIANTGEEACRVKITRLDLSYTDTLGERAILNSDINGIQLLSDGTAEKSWGTFLGTIGTGNEFVIPNGVHGYVHPFGHMARIPENATELTVSFALELVGDCAASGGIDTYSEWGFHPPGTNGYTQDGSPTDFIKEALKTPWVTETTDPTDPVSYSFPYIPMSERDLPGRE